MSIQDSPSSCELCKSSLIFRLLPARDYISGDSFSIYYCNQCCVGFTWPRPGYIQNYYPKQYRKFSSPTRRFMRLLYRLHMRSWTGSFIKPGKVLEIGCGSGWMLKTLQEIGWEVVGFERNSEEALHVAKVTGFRVLSGDLSVINSEKFDLIILFNVLEHLGDPEIVLKQCSNLLKSGGMLILNVPNFESLQANLMKEHWTHLDVPRHLFHFSKRSLHFVLDRSGLTPTRIKYISWVHDPYGWVSSLLNCFRFQQNELTRLLMKEDFSDLLTLKGGIMSVVAAMILVPSIFLSMMTWLIGKGAMIEIWAKKENHA